MADSRPGMRYSEADQRLGRIQRNPGNQQAKLNLASSIVRQVALREGQGAANELVKKYSRSY